MRLNNLKVNASSLRVLPTYLITFRSVIIFLTAISSAQTPPTATTGSASVVTSSKATLNGTVNPKWFSTIIIFNMAQPPVMDHQPREPAQAREKHWFLLLLQYLASPQILPIIFASWQSVLLALATATTIPLLLHLQLSSYHRQ